MPSPTCLGGRQQHQQVKSSHFPSHFQSSFKSHTRRGSIMVVAINLSCWGAGRTSALGWTPKPWETPHQCLRTRANTSWHCRSQPYFEQSQWYRVLVPGPAPQVRSLSWPLEQILCVGVVVAISNLFRWAVEPATGQIVTRTITPSLTASKAQQAGGCIMVVAINLGSVGDVRLMPLSTA